MKDFKRKVNEQGIIKHWNQTRGITFHIKNIIKTKINGESQVDDF